MLMKLALSAVAVATFAMVAAQPAVAAEPAKGKYFEMRIYTAAAGKMDALHARFRDHTLKLFKKHGIESVAYWTAVDEKNVGKLVFVIAYPDQPSRDKLWNAFAQDPEWLKAKDASEKDGKLVDKVEQIFMTGTDYSPVK
jgi:hypothetical protein